MKTRNNILQANLQVTYIVLSLPVERRLWVVMLFGCICFIPKWIKHTEGYTQYTRKTMTGLHACLSHIYLRCRKTGLDKSRFEERLAA